MYINREVVYDNVTMTVYGEMSPEEPEVRYDSDMSGYPGCSAEFEIEKIEVGGFDVTNILDKDVFEPIKQLVLEANDEQ